MPGEELAIAAASNMLSGGQQTGGKKNLGFIGSPEFLTGVADQGINAGWELYKYFTDRKDKNNQFRDKMALAQEQQNTEQQAVLNEQANKQRASGMNALQYLAQQRQAATGPSRTRLRDSLLFGG